MSVYGPQVYKYGIHVYRLLSTPLTFISKALSDLLNG